jgi:hypothetical protein
MFKRCNHPKKHLQKYENQLSFIVCSTTHVVQVWFFDISMGKKYDFIDFIYSLGKGLLALKNFHQVKVWVYEN